MTLPSCPTCGNEMARIEGDGPPFCLLCYKPTDEEIQRDHEREQLKMSLRQVEYMNHGISLRIYPHIDPEGNIFWAAIAKIAQGDSITTLVHTVHHVNRQAAESAARKAMSDTIVRLDSFLKTLNLGLPL